MAVSYEYKQEIKKSLAKEIYAMGFNTPKLSVTQKKGIAFRPFRTTGFAKKLGKLEEFFPEEPMGLARKSLNEALEELKKIKYGPVHFDFVVYYEEEGLEIYTILDQNLLYVAEKSKKTIKERIETLKSFAEKYELTQELMEIEIKMLFDKKTEMETLEKFEAKIEIEICKGFHPLKEMLKTKIKKCFDQAEDELRRAEK